MKLKNIFLYHKNELLALLLFFVGGTLGMLGLIQRVPLVLGILGRRAGIGRRQAARPGRHLG